MAADVRTAVAIGKPGGPRYRRLGKAYAGQGSMITMSAVWDRTSAVLRDHLPAVAAIAFLTLYLPSVINSIVQPVSDAAAPAPKRGLELLSLGLSLLTLFGRTVLVALVLQPGVSQRRAYSEGSRRFPAVLAICLILFVALVALIIPPLIIAVAGGMDVNALSAGVAPNIDPISALIIALYVLVLTPLVVWMGARLILVGPLVAPVIVAERNGLRNIVRGFAMTRGLASRIVGVVFLFLAVALVAGLAARAVFGSIFRLAFSGTGPINTASVLTALVTALVSTTFMVILTVFCTQLYVAARDRSNTVPAAA